MTSSRWDRVSMVFEEALRRPAGDRRVYLDEACDGDAALRREVEALLRAEDAIGDAFLSEPPAGLAAAALDDAPAALEVAGRRVGPYRLEREIGRGGMGAVYLARRDDVDLAVALKVATGGLASPDRVARFHAERRLLARLAHPAIARLLDAGVLDDGTPWFAMEYVPGQPLDRYSDDERLTIEARLGLFCGVCEAVAFAHRNLIVHRDLKPANILVTPEGAPKLLDFGIAKLIEDGAASADLTVEGARLLTPEYAAPEQITGDAVTTATDVYALGVLLYRLLTGTSPYPRDGSNGLDLHRVVHGEEPSAPSRVITRQDDAASLAAARRTTTVRLRRRLDGELDAIVLKALARDPDARYPSAERLLEDVRASLESRPVSARPPTRRYRLGRFVRRNRGSVAAALGLLLILSGSVAALALQRAEIRRERDRARLEAARAGQVSDFLQGLFAASDPYRGAGTEMPVGVLLEQGRQRVDELADQPEVQAGMMEVLGRVYTSLGDYTEAQTLYVRALETRRALHGEDHLDVARAMGALGQVMGTRGVLDSAAALHRGAREIAERVGAGGTLEHAEMDLQLGTLLLRLADFPGAVESYRSALDLYERLLAYPDVRIAQAQANLGLAYDGQRMLDEAERWKRASVRTFEALPGDQSTNLAQAYNNLAVTLERRGRFEEAETLQRQVLDAKRASLPAGHASIGVTMTNLGSVLTRLEQYDEAETLFAEALTLQRAAVGPDHRYVANALDGLSEVAAARGDLERAEAWSRESLDVVQRGLGAEHPRAATVLLHLGRLRQRRDDGAEAQTLLREAVRIREGRLGDDAQATAVARLALASVLIDASEFDEAERLLDAVVRVTSRTEPDNPGTRRGALEERVRLYTTWGRHDRAAAARAALDPSG